MTDLEKQSRGMDFLKLIDEARSFTEELLEENKKLRQRNEILSIAKDRLDDLMEKKVPSAPVPQGATAPHSLEVRIELDELRTRFAEVEKENKEFAERYVKVESQNSNLVNLYIASQRLHSTLDYTEVVQIMKEVVINMIGSEEFGIYMADVKGTSLVRIEHEGLNSADERPIPIDGSFLGDAFKKGELYINEKALSSKGAEREPISIIPLKMENTVLGLIVIYSLLLQKSGFEPVDHELFDLLGGQAATALYASRLFSTSERKRNTLESFIHLLKSDSPARAQSTE